jgi:hypothetical protein
MSLTTIAQQMRAKAEVEGTAYRGLRNGLCLLLSHQGGEWTLALWRVDTLPSDNEVAVIRRDFDIPAHATESAPDQIAWLDERRRGVDAPIVLTWTERLGRATPPSPHQRAHLGSLIARGDLDGARTYATNQTAQGGTNWTLCPEWQRWAALLSDEPQLSVVQAALL